MAQRATRPSEPHDFHQFAESHHSPTMTHRKALKTPEDESRIQEGLNGLKNGRFQSVRHAARELNISRGTLQHRFNGRVSRSISHSEAQALTSAEEDELVRWITQLTITGYPPRHDTLWSMAETIRKRRIPLLTNGTPNLFEYQLLGKDWMKLFLKRHTELKTRIGRAIDAARVKDTSKEALMIWFNAFQQTIQEKEILPENTYNFDESGFSIGKIEASRVIINSRIRQKYQAQPGRQEWVSVIECIGADGTSIPPLVIFKGENLSQQWIPADISEDWKFACNTRGWTSNIHGLEWLIRCFDPVTREKAGGKTRALICDGHESHVTGDFIEYCRNNNIELLLLVPHSSHMTQPLDVAIFGPLKKAMAAELHGLIQTEVARIQKAEWLSAYTKAHARTFTSWNIHSAFSGAGLIPFCPNKVIRRIAKSLSPPPQALTPENLTVFDIPTLSALQSI